MSKFKPVLTSFSQQGKLKSNCDNKESSGGFGAVSLYITTETMPPTPFSVLSPEGLSLGSVLLIISFSFLIAYCVLGVIYKFKVKGTQGAESVPNIDLWREFPGLALFFYFVDCSKMSVEICLTFLFVLTGYVRAGCAFTWGKLRGRPAEFDEL